MFSWPSDLLPPDFDLELLLPLLLSLLLPELFDPFRLFSFLELPELLDPLGLLSFLELPELSDLSELPELFDRLGLPELLDSRGWLTEVGRSATDSKGGLSGQYFLYSATWSASCLYLSSKSLIYSVTSSLTWIASSYCYFNSWVHGSSKHCVFSCSTSSINSSVISTVCTISSIKSSHSSVSS